MIKKLLAVLVIALFIGVNIGIVSAQDNTTTDQPQEVVSSIPNLTQPEDAEDTNGRAAHLDTEKEGDQLNPVERTIIIRDAIRSNNISN